MLINTQSIKTKEDLLTDYMGNEAIDMTIATETWLTDHDRDVIWMESNRFMKDGYQVSEINRVGKKGGGLALIYRSNITATKMVQKQCISFEAAHWMITIGNSIPNILGIYHPPCSINQKITNSIFLDDLTDFLTEWMDFFRNIIICGDFDSHIDDPNDTEAQIFNYTMKALGLQQHVSFPTHHASNTLDLIFTETTSQLNTKTSKGRYILDHRAIMTESDIRIQHTISRMVTFRNLKQINVEEFKSALNFGSIENIEDLDLVNEKYENELTRVLDQLAPEKN